MDRQSIYTGGAASQNVAQRRLLGVPFNLRINCRNTPRIVHYVHMLGQLHPPYSRVRRPDTGIDPTVQTYSNQKTQLNLLANLLGRLTKEGYRPEDIAILSPYGDEQCAAAGLAEPWAEQVAPLRSLVGAGKVAYCTIHAFKGLDAPAVIVTDLDAVGTQAAADLLYIALTRSLDRLCLLVSETAAVQLQDIVISGSPEGDKNA